MSVGPDAGMEPRRSVRLTPGTRCPPAHRYLAGCVALAIGLLGRVDPARGRRAPHIGRHGGAGTLASSRPLRVSPRARLRVARSGCGPGHRARPRGVRGLSCIAMRLSFRQRILLVLICLGAIPTAAAVLGWSLTIRSTTPAAGAEKRDGRGRLVGPDTAAYPRLHSTRATRAAAPSPTTPPSSTRPWHAFSGRDVRPLLLRGSGARGVPAWAPPSSTHRVRLGGHLSRQLSRPIEELIGWTGHIRRKEPLPPDSRRSGRSGIRGAQDRPPRDG